MLEHGHPIHFWTTWKMMGAAARLVHRCLRENLMETSTEASES